MTHVFIEVVSQTWAYIQGQLDFAPSKWIKTHILIESNSDKTLCGKRTIGWEWGDEIIWPINVSDDDCKICFRKFERLSKSQ